MNIHKLKNSNKIIIESGVPIYLGNSDIIIETINISIRYRKEGDVFVFCKKRSNNIINKLSRKYSIKMINILPIYNTGKIDCCDIVFIDGFKFNNLKWFRDYQLRKLKI